MSRRQLRSRLSRRQIGSVHKNGKTLIETLQVHSILFQLCYNNLTGELRLKGMR